MGNIRHTSVQPDYQGSGGQFLLLKGKLQFTQMELVCRIRLPWLIQYSHHFQKIPSLMKSIINKHTNDYTIEKLAFS